MPTTYGVVIPDAAATTIEDCIAAKYGYTVADGTKAEFVVAQLRIWLKEQVVAAEANEAGATAADAERIAVAALIA